jgi:hypothetical protein
MEDKERTLIPLHHTAVLAQAEVLVVVAAVVVVVQVAVLVNLRS